MFIGTEPVCNIPEVGSIGVVKGRNQASVHGNRFQFDPQQANNTRI